MFASKNCSNPIECLILDDKVKLETYHSPTPLLLEYSLIQNLLVELKIEAGTRGFCFVDRP